MNTRLIIIPVLLCIMFGCISEHNTGADIKVGDSLPEFEVVMNDGTVVTETSLKGNVSVLIFFHTSCPDCQQELPVVQNLFEQYASKNIRFTLISRECSHEEIEAYWRENSLNLPYSAQNDRTIYNLFAQSRIPRIYISDENGTVRYIFTDDPVASYYDLKSAIESLIR